MKKSTLATILSLTLVIGLVYCQSRSKVVDLRKSAGLSFKSPQAMMSPDMIQLIAGEFRGLVADYMLLEVGSFEGSNTQATDNDYRNIYHALKQSLVLDPYFQQTYFYVQGLLPWNGKLVNETIELLNVSRKHRPWDWQPGNYIGFDYYYFKSDFAKASDILLQTAKIKNAPVFLAILGARFAAKGQRTEAAIVMLERMLKDEVLVEHDRREMKQRLAALKGVLLLEKAIRQYRVQTQNLPPDLQALLKEGIIRSMPKNPYADHYFYDAQTGKVSFDQVRTLTVN